MRRLKAIPYRKYRERERYQPLELDNKIGDATHLIEDSKEGGAICLCFNVEDAEMIAKCLNFENL